MTETLVTRLRAMAARFDMTATERYEQDAEAFYAATGYMAPGKDVPMAMGGQDEQDRRRAHDAWIQARNEAQKRTLEDAAAALAAAHAERDAAIAATWEEAAQIIESLHVFRDGRQSHSPVELRGAMVSVLRGCARTALRERDALAAQRPVFRDCPDRMSFLP